MSGLVIFNAHRDDELEKMGWKTHDAFVAEVRVEFGKRKQQAKYATMQPFQLWNATRDDVLKKAGVKGGYRGLMALAKASHAQNAKMSPTSQWKDNQKALRDYGRLHPSSAARSMAARLKASPPPAVVTHQRIAARLKASPLGARTIRRPVASAAAAAAKPKPRAPPRKPRA